jgi:dienelactone hydrolase
MLAFSMGGAVSVRAADEPSVVTVLGLAPWLPDQLSLEPLRGKRLRVLHGSLDRGLPGIPGVAPDMSKRAFERALALGVEGEYALIRGGLHGVALRAPSGRLLALPRASTWASLVAGELASFGL